MAALERSTTVELQDKASKDAMYQMIGKFGLICYQVNRRYK